MKNLLTSLIILTYVFNINQLNAQEISRFPINPTSEWRINYEYACSAEEFIHQSGDQEYKYFIKGDTLIGGKTFLKLYKTGILFLETPVEIKDKYIGAIRDSANRYFFVEESKTSESLLYNFDAKVGESICPDCSGMGYIVGEIYTLENGRKKFYIDIITVHCGSANILIEGIGWLGGLLEGNSCYAHPGIRGSYLLCYSENGIPVYESEMSHRCGKIMECNNIFTPVDQINMPAFSPQITLINNRLLEISFSNHTGNTPCQIEVYSLTGQKLRQIKTTLPVTVDFSSFGKGIYLVKVRNGHSAVTSKFLIR